VQGSVLGPKLFAIHCNGLENVLKGSYLAANAEDAYVTVSYPSETKLKLKLESTPIRLIDWQLLFRIDYSFSLKKNFTTIQS